MQKNHKIQKTYKHTKLKLGACYQYKKARQSKNENADKYQKRVKIQKSKKNTTYAPAIKYKE